MNILNNVVINGFWDKYTFKLELYPDVNFLIGANGSGKTTAINIIAAALEADFVALDRLPFSKISLQLSEIGGNRRPIIEVEKKGIRKSPFLGIKYLIREKASAKPIEYSLDHFEEQLALRDYPPQYLREHLYRSRGMLEHLKKLINTSWLSIHRTESKKAPRDERGYESTVDKKLNEQSNEFVRYFSSLSKQADVEVEEFQKMVFSSLISQPKREDLFSAVLRLDIDEEKKALTDIFKQFNVAERIFSKDLAKHFSTFKRAVELIEKKEGIPADDFVSIISAHRIHSVVQEWKKVLQRRDIVFEPREAFISTVNSLFKWKKLIVNEKNDLLITTELNKLLPLTQLSSGEKQILIILGEAVLQNKTPWVYIADEPELSLHVEWQEKLIKSIRGLNPNAQILFATHSPDIVSTFSDHVFDMEALLA